MALIDGALLSVSEALEAHFLLSLQRLAQATQDSWVQAFPALLSLTLDMINLPSPGTTGSCLESRAAGMSVSLNLCDSWVRSGSAGSSFALGEDF